MPFPVTLHHSLPSYFTPPSSTTNLDGTPVTSIPPISPVLTKPRHHPSVHPLIRAFFFSPSLLQTSYSFIALVYSVASSYTTLLLMVYCCLPSFIYSLTLTTSFSQFSLFIYLCLAFPFSVSPQFTITMISVSVASLQAAAFMGHL